MQTTPTFSILHPSARPAKWREIYEAWLRAANDPGAVEYVLVTDERWGFPAPVSESGGAAMYQNMRAQDRVAVNNGRRCYVDAVNTAASVSTGAVLIVIADDQYPAQGWDSLLKHAAGEAMTKGGDQFVLWAHTGTPQEYERQIIVMPIVSRGRYQRLGYIFFGQYESMYADNDLCAHAIQDGVMHQLPNDPAWTFPHLHPFFSNTAMDEQYEVQNRPEAYALGAEIFKRRGAARFADIPPVVLVSGPQRKHLAVCLPGRWWPLEFMSAWTDLVLRITQVCNFTPVFGSASDPGVVRDTLAAELKKVDTPIDFVLWIDNDNVVPFPYVMEMLKTLHEHPDIHAVAGWCWLLYPAGRISCGQIGENGHMLPLDHTAMMAAPDDLQEIAYTGFPAILMRREVIDMAGPFPFVPIVNSGFSHGKSGEDYAFCVRAREAGARFVVDRRLKVPHLKLGALDGSAAAAAPAPEQIPVPAGEAT